MRLAKNAEITKNDAVCFDTMMSLPALYFPIDDVPEIEIGQK
jgi:hypothetical protein